MTIKELEILGKLAKEEVLRSNVKFSSHLPAMEAYKSFINFIGTARQEGRLDEELIEIARKEKEKDSV